MIFENAGLLAVLGATVASIMIGFVWYGPLFGKQWAKEQGWSDKDMEQRKAKGMGKSYAFMTLGSLATSYVLAMLAKTLGAITLTDGVTVGILVWLGFAVPLLLSSILWEGKSVRLYIINIGYNLVTFATMGAIVALWG